MKVQITTDRSIKAAFIRLIVREVGDVPITIETIDRDTHNVTIDATLTPEQKLKLKNDITTFLETQGLYVSFEILEP